MNTLRVGDEVEWRGSWGGDAPRRARVMAIEVLDGTSDKHGLDTDEVAWEPARDFIVDLDNGHWAYGTQLAPVQRKEEATLWTH